MSPKKEIKLLPGELDSDFGQDGILRLTKQGGILNYIKRGAVDSRGRILLAASFKTKALQQYAVVRLTADGQQDSTFADQGVAVGQFAGKDAHAASVSMTLDNKIVLSCTSGDLDDSGNPIVPLVNYLARFDEAGALDPAFGSAGVVPVIIPRPEGQKAVGPKAFERHIQHEYACVVSPLEKNKLLYTCMSGLRSGSGYLPFSVLGRLSADGESDATFHKTGHVYIEYPPDTEIFVTEVMQSFVLGDRLFVAGDTLSNRTPSRFFLRRYDLNGEVDTTFGGGSNENGFVVTEPLGERLSGAHLRSVFRMGPTLVLMGNNLLSDTERGVMAGFTLEGAVDGTFNGGALLHGQLPGILKPVLWVQGAASGEGFVALGYSGAPGSAELVVARYLANGLLDERFGSGKGWATGPYGIDPKALLIQTRDGLPNRILVTGVVTPDEYAVVLAFTDVDD